MSAIYNYAKDSFMNAVSLETFHKAMLGSQYTREALDTTEKVCYATKWGGLAYAHDVDKCSRGVYSEAIDRFLQSPRAIILGGAVIAGSLAGAYYLDKKCPAIRQKAANALSTVIDKLPLDAAKRKISNLYQSVANHVSLNGARNRIANLCQPVIARYQAIANAPYVSTAAKATAMFTGTYLLSSYPVLSLALSSLSAMKPNFPSYKHMPTVISLATALNGYYMGDRSFFVGALGLAVPIISALKGTSSAQTNWTNFGVLCAGKRFIDWLSPATIPITMKLPGGIVMSGLLSK